MNPDTGRIVYAEEPKKPNWLDKYKTKPVNSNLIPLTEERAKFLSSMSRSERRKWAKRHKKILFEEAKSEKAKIYEIGSLGVRG